MIDLATTDGSAQRFDLAPDDRVTRKGAIDPVTAPRSAFIEITEPLVTPITKALVANDAELAAFWESEKRRFRYDYVQFRCTLMPADNMPFEKAWLEVHLESSAGEKGPIAYSMHPDKLVIVASLSDSAKLGSDFKLVKSEIQTKTETETEIYFLRAWREQTADPYWAFSRTETTELAGTYRFHLVTRTPAEIGGRGKLTARAVVAKRTFLIFNREKLAGEPASLTFALERR